MKVEQLDKKRFDALIHQSRSPAAAFTSKELSWWTVNTEAVIGIVLRDTVDEDYLAIAMGRDEVGLFRAIDIEVSFETIEEAQNWLHVTMRQHSRNGKRMFPQGDSQRKSIDFFKQIVPDDKLHPFFVHLKNEDHYLPAREIINLIAPHFVDIDGNYVEQFQTTGFDSRLWELYLHAYFVEEELFFDREHNAPDFIVKKYGHKIGIEAVIVGRKSDNPVQVIKPDAEKHINIPEEHENAMPIRFGSPLYSKLKKKYWELPQIKGCPLIFAIADFHDDQSMLWSSSALVHYLYGVKQEYRYDENGELVIDSIPIEKHKVGSKEIPSGFFFQPDVENISAVMFSASGTISKFSRMGRQAGFKHPDISIFRHGLSVNQDENANQPNQFRYEVDETCKETWAEGLSLFHNPNAKHPIPLELFPNIAHHKFENNQILSLIPKFHPYGSVTMFFKVVE